MARITGRALLGLGEEEVLERANHVSEGRPAVENRAKIARLDHRRVAANVDDGAVDGDHPESGYPSDDTVAADCRGFDRVSGLEVEHQ